MDYLALKHTFVICLCNYKLVMHVIDRPWVVWWVGSYLYILRCLLYIYIYTWDHLRAYTIGMVVLYLLWFLLVDEMSFVYNFILLGPSTRLHLWMAGTPLPLFTPIYPPIPQSPAQPLVRTQHNRLFSRSFDRLNFACLGPSTRLHLWMAGTWFGTGTAVN